MRGGAVKCSRCHNRAAQAKYQKSAKGKATMRRYRVTDKGRANDAKFNARRIFVNGYYGTADAETAQAINEHVRQRIRAFKASQPKG